MSFVLVAVLTDMLVQNNPDLSPRTVCTEFAWELTNAGYPFTARQVTTQDALAMLESLDAGKVRSTPEQRAAL